MNKEFVPYEEALALKEIGFDEPCFGWFTFGYLRIGSIVESKHVQGEGELLAPTYSKAFRWFREKYNIKPCFDWHPTEKYRYCIYYSKNKYFQKCDFLTHEEAELECLKKLIEIVNNE